MGEAIEQIGGAMAQQALTVGNKEGVIKLFDRFKADFAAALPEYLTVERMMRLALTTFAKNPTLYECTQASVVGAVLEACQCGLEIDDGRDHAYLIPFRNKGTLEATFMPGYKGLSFLAHNSGVLAVTPHVVYENDKFRFTVRGGPEHEPLMKGDRGRPVAVYSLAKLPGGEWVWSPEPWPWTRVLDHRDRFEKRKGGSGLRMTDEDYGKKSVIRELCKYLPASPQLARAVTISERADAPIETTWTSGEDMPQALSGKNGDDEHDSDVETWEDYIRSFQTVGEFDGVEAEFRKFLKNIKKNKEAELIKLWNERKEAIHEDSRGSQPETAGQEPAE